MIATVMMRDREGCFSQAFSLVLSAPLQREKFQLNGESSLVPQQQTSHWFSGKVCGSSFCADPPCFGAALLLGRFPQPRSSSSPTSLSKSSFHGGK